MANDATKVIATRNMIVYTEPWLAANAMVTDSVWGTPWGGSWAPVGFTKDGLHVRMQTQRQNITVDQQVDPILRVPTNRDLQLQTKLAQITPTNLLTAAGGAAADETVVAAVSGTEGHDDYDVNGVIADNYYSVGFDIENNAGTTTQEAIRVVGWKALALSEIQVDFGVQDAAQIALDMACVPDTSATPTRIMKFRYISPALA